MNYVLVIMLGALAIPFGFVWRFSSKKTSGFLRGAVAVTLFSLQLFFLLAVVVFVAPALLNDTSPDFEFSALIVVFSVTYVICASIVSKSRLRK
jgi:hypothetical protein